MFQISYVKYTDILEARRYDAEYFRPEYLKDDFSLEKKGYNFLICISDVKGGKRLPLGENFSVDGSPYIRAEDIKNDFIQHENASKISEELHKKLINYQIKKNDIVLTIVGSVGSVGLAKFNIKKCNLTENAAKITNLREIKPEVLFIYLLSKFGQNIIYREKVGTVQEKLSLERIRKFKVPIFSEYFQLQIEEITKLAYQKQTQSKQLYCEAEEILLKDLKLLDCQIKSSLYFTARKNEVSEAHRFDSEYFQPKYVEIIKKIEEYAGGWDFAGEIVKWRKGVEVGTEAYTETGKDFVRVSDFSINGISETSRKISDQAFDKLKKSYQPKQGEILFTKDGTIGLSYVLKEDIQGVLSGAFLRLTLKEKYQYFEKECLSLIFSSILCKMQVEKLSGGALISHLKPSDFETFKIPLIKSSIQKKIAEKIQESHKLQKESKELLEEAKRKMEEEIEK